MWKTGEGRLVIVRSHNDGAMWDFEVLPRVERLFTGGTASELDSAGSIARIVNN